MWEKAKGCAVAEEKTRLQYWDIAKGITILLVVMGHVDSINPYVRGIIFSYHMPFFFIANAYFIKNYNVGENIRKSARSILVPYCVVSLICAVIGVIRNSSQIPDYLIFGKFIRDMIAGMSKCSNYFKSFDSVWLIWFLPCLFAAKIVYVAIMGHMQKFPATLQLLVFMMLAAVGIVVGEDVAYLPWSFDIALAALPFMWTGDYLHKTDALNRYKTWCVVSALFIWVLLGSQKIFIEMAMRYYPGFYLCMLEAVSGSIVVIVFSKILENKAPVLSGGFAWCGKHSMIILAIHNLEARFFNWEKYIFSRLLLEENWIEIFCIKIVFILLITWAVVFVKESIRRRGKTYGPENASGGR